MRTFKWRFLASQLSYRVSSHAKTTSSHCGASICHENMPRFEVWWNFDHFSVGLDSNFWHFSNFEHVSNFKHFSILNMMKTRTWCECEQAEPSLRVSRRGNTRWRFTSALKWLEEKVPRRVIVCSQGEMDMMKTLNTDVRFDPLKCDLLKIQPFVWRKLKRAR